MRAMILTLAAAAMFSVPALADDVNAPVQATPVSATTQDIQNQVSCRMTYHEGVIIAADRTCLTKEQWDLYRIQNQKLLRDQQLHSMLQFNR